MRDAASSDRLVDVKAMSVAIARGLMAIVSPILMFYFVIYFILGFLLISSFLAAIGSACNTVKEAQTLMGPLDEILLAHSEQIQQRTLTGMEVLAKLIALAGVAMSVSHSTAPHAWQAARGGRYPRMLSRLISKNLRSAHSAGAWSR